MRSRLVPITVALLLGLAACSGDAEDEAQTPDTTADTEVTTTSTTGEPAEPLDARARVLGAIEGAGGSDPGERGEGVGAPPPRPGESFEPAHNVEPTESEIPMFEG